MSNLRFAVQRAVRFGLIGCILSAACAPVADSRSGLPIVPAAAISDPGAALMLARHAIAIGGLTADRQQTLITAESVYADDPIVQVLIDRIQIDQQPNDLAPLRTLIAADMKLHNWQDAVIRLAQLSIRDPSDAGSRFQLAILLLPTRPADSQAQLRALIGDPSIGTFAQSALQSLTTQPLSTARRSIGIQLTGASQWALGSYLLQPLVNAAPQDHTGAALLGLAEESQGYDGWPLIQSALAANPADPLIQYAAALHWQHIGDSQAALNALIKAGTIKSASVTQQAALDIAIGSAYSQNGSLDQAATWLQKARDLLPRDRRTAEVLAAFYADEQYRPDLGQLFIRTTIAQFPNDAVLYASLGQVLLDRGQFAAALQAAQQAVTLDPARAYTQLVLGRCLEAQGDRQGARQAWESALHTRDPAGEVYRTLASKALAQIG